MIPVKAGRSRTLRLLPASIQIMGAVPADPQKRRVLVVDDELNIAELGATALRYEGFELRIAGDGAQAQATVRDFAPALVVRAT